MPGLARVEELRDFLHVDRRAGVRGRIRPRERAVRGAEIDADDEAGGHRIEETSTSAGATTLWPVDGRGGKATRVASHPR